MIYKIRMWIASRIVGRDVFVKNLKIRGGFGVVFDGEGRRTHLEKVTFTNVQGAAISEK